MPKKKRSHPALLTCLLTCGAVSALIVTAGFFLAWQKTLPTPQEQEALEPFEMQIAFSEPVEGFGASDIQVEGGTIRVVGCGFPASVEGEAVTVTNGSGNTFIYTVTVDPSNPEE